MDSIPIDLSYEIFSRLSSKSIARCRCVSRQWDSMLQRPDFRELFLARSSSRPRILFAMLGSGEEQRDEFLFYSSTQQCQYHIPYKTLDFHMKLPGDMSPETWGYASGLMYFPNIWNSKKVEDRVNVICNPSTGLCADLPKLDMPQDRHSRSFLGFDPIDKQFKILFVAKIPTCDDGHRILTLGTGKMSWRKIQCFLTHNPSEGKGICINGVLYYFAEVIDKRSSSIVCFDVRTENFKYIDRKTFGRWSSKLINYKGKLGVIDDTSMGKGILDLSMWVLDDIEKQEWSEHAYSLANYNITGKVSVVGGTANGEIVLLSSYHKQGVFDFHLWNPERTTLESNRIETNHEALVSCSNGVYAFANHEEDLEFNVIKKTYAATSVNPRLRSKFQSINNFDALCLSDDD